MFRELYEAIQEEVEYRSWIQPGVQCWIVSDKFDAYVRGEIIGPDPKTPQSYFVRNFATKEEEVVHDTHLTPLGWEEEDIAKGLKR